MQKNKDTKSNNIPNFSIIVLNYNALEYTKKCIEAINKNTKVTYELILIDNNSIDGTPEWLVSQWEKDLLGDNVILLNNDHNKGVAGGRNQGIEHASGEIIVFLDNDTEVGAGWDFEIMKEFNNHRVGVVGHGGANVKSYRPLAWDYVTLTDNRSEVDVISGYCFAFKRQLIDLVGNQWVDFPNSRFWHEDLEFCRRIKLAGYKIVLNRNIKIKHHAHKSMGNEKGDILKPENQFGYQENAAYIATRFLDENIVYIYKDYKGKGDMSAYERAIFGLSEQLRKLGMVVIRKESIAGGSRSYNLCKMFDMTYKGKYFVAMYQENDRAPKAWETDLKDVDYILAGSKHFIDCAKGTSYENKVLDCPPAGFNVDVFNMGEAPSKVYSNKFIFLMVGASQPRKNTQQLIKSYSDAFKGREDVVLIIKDGGYGQFFDTRKFIDDIKKVNKECPEIIYIYDNVPEKQLADLYRAVSANGCYVHPHKAECFGMPLIEAVACGCRVITTGWGGPKYTLEGLPTVKFLDYKLVTSAFHNWKGEPFYEKDEDPKWALPSEEDLIHQMRLAKESEYDPDLALKASREITSRFSYAALARNYHEVLTSLDI